MSDPQTISQTDTSKLIPPFSNLISPLASSSPASPPSLLLPVLSSLHPLQPSFLTSCSHYPEDRIWTVSIRDTHTHTRQHNRDLKTTTQAQSFLQNSIPIVDEIRWNGWLMSRIGHDAVGGEVRQRIFFSPTPPLNMTSPRTNPFKLGPWLILSGVDM